MLYREFEELLENSNPQAFVMFDDGAYVVGAHKEFTDSVRLFRSDDMGFTVGSPLIPNRDVAAQRAEDPDRVENLYGVLTAQCGWTMHGADMVVSLPNEMFFRYVEYVETLNDGTVVLSVGDRRIVYI